MKVKTRQLKNLLGRLWLPLCFCIFLCLDLAFRYFYATSASLRILNRDAIVFSVCWAAVFCGILWALPGKLRRVAMVALVAFFALLCVVHGVMYNLFGNFFSFSDLAYTGDGAKFFSFSYLKVRLGMIACCLLAVAGAVIGAVCMDMGKERKLRLVAAAALVALGIFGIARQDRNIKAQTAQDFTWGWNADASNYVSMTNVNRAMSQTGIYQYLLRSFTVTFAQPEQDYTALYAQLDEYYAASEKNAHPDNEMTGLLAGKNVFFIMLESVDSWLLTQDYMPNLYSLKQQSVDFVNHYSPLYISAGTFNTEFIANTGLVPPTSGIDGGVYAENDFPNSLARIFTQAGYTVNSFHSANPTIYNRGNIHRNLGYEAYHNWQDMGMENYMLDSQLISGFDAMTAREPFFDFLITYSGHGPYTEELSVISDPHMERARALVSQAEVPLTGADLSEYTYAVAHAMETDIFVGELVAALEERGLLEDTVLIFFTDHYGKYMTNTQALYTLKGVNSQDMLSNTPFFLYSPDLDARTVEKLTSTVDIAPTVANLFGLDANYAWYAGDDIFGTGGGSVLFRGGNWYDGQIYYIPGASGELTGQAAQRYAQATQAMNMAWDALRSDYFAHLQ